MAAVRRFLSDLLGGLRTGFRAIADDPNPTANPRDVLQDAGPPHTGALCLPEGIGGWLCRYPLGDGHRVHTPYVEGEYLR